MNAVNIRANQLITHAFSLAERGALFAARAQFIQALRRVSQALDAGTRSDRHSVALANGLRALHESEDFVPQGSHLEAELSLSSIIVGHQTPVLKNKTDDSMSAVIALQHYFAYAQDELAKAAGGQPAAANALYGLGKLQTVFADQSANAMELHGPRAMTFHQAALLVNPQHHKAANELGVLLARYGELNRAAEALRRSLRIHQEAATWHNLAVVHERMGDHDLAKRAHYELQLIQQQELQTDDPVVPNDNKVQWLPPTEFAKTGPQGTSRPPAVAPAVTPNTKADNTDRAASWWKDWLKLR